MKDKDTEIVAIIPAPAGVTVRAGRFAETEREPVFAFGQLKDGRVVPLVERFGHDEGVERVLLGPVAEESWALVATWGPRCHCEGDDGVSAGDPTYCEVCRRLLPGGS